MHDFTKKLRQKGYTAREVAKLLDITPRSLSRIAKNPKKIHLLALAGLPDRKKKDLERESK